MKHIISSALIALVVAVPASAQSRLKLPPNLFAAGQTVPGQAPPTVPLPVQTDSGGPRVSLTLEDAVKRALENNLDIAVERIGQQIFDVNMASIRSVYSPVVSSLISNQSSKNASTSTISGGQTGATITNSTFVFNGGLAQDVKWGGGNFSATLDNRRQETSNLTATINPSYQPTWSAQYTQPLLRDFKIDATRQQLLVTRINQDISDIQLQQITMNTVANVRNAYWDYVFAVQSVDVARQSLLLADELLRNNQTKVEIGTMAPIDVVQAQSQAAQQTAGGRHSRRHAPHRRNRLEAAHRQRHGGSAMDSDDRARRSPRFPAGADRPVGGNAAGAGEQDRCPAGAEESRSQRHHAAPAQQPEAAAGRPADAIRDDRHRRHALHHRRGQRRRSRRDHRHRSRRLSRRAGHAVPQQASDMEHGAEHQLQPRHERRTMHRSRGRVFSRARSRYSFGSSTCR